MGQDIACSTCARMIGPPCDAKSLASLSLFTTRVTNFCMSFCIYKEKNQGEDAVLIISVCSKIYVELFFFLEMHLVWDVRN